MKKSTLVLLVGNLYCVHLIECRGSRVTWTKANVNINNSGNNIGAVVSSQKFNDTIIGGYGKLFRVRVKL